MQPLPEAEFETLVGDALDSLPDEFFELMDNVVVLVEDEPPDDQPEDLLGLYEGIPHTDRGEYGYMDLPDRITLYRLPLCRFVGDRAELVDEVRVTVVHEVAHHFGIDDDRLHDLGWA
jgi:predicted Zn-dependent protease with MMP-like domain